MAKLSALDTLRQLLDAVRLPPLTVVPTKAPDPSELPFDPSLGAPEERAAWDLYAAAALFKTLNPSTSQALANQMLAKRRQQFGDMTNVEPDMEPET